MLEYMRKNVGSWIIKFMLFGIVIVFSFWGVGSYTNRNVNTIMTIDDVKVPYSEYRNVYNNLYDNYKAAYDKMDSATLKSLNIKQQAIDTLTQRYLLYDAARRMGMEVTSSEVAAQIASMPTFQENGVFSRGRYQQFLDLNRLSAEAYEASLSRDILLAKVTDAIEANAVITPQEVQDNLTLLTRKAVAKVIKLSPNDFVNSVKQPTEAELKDFFDENIEQYRIPETFRENVVVIDPSRYKKQVTVTDKEIQDRYDDMEKKYTEPAAYHLKHILFSLPKDASAQTIKDVRAKAEKTVSEIRDGKISFKDAVKRFSGDKNSIAKNGDIGFQEESRLERPVLIEARDLKPGEISDPIPTAKGFEIISVIEAREQRLIPLADVRQEIKEKITGEKALDLAYDQSDDLIDGVEKSGKSLLDLAKEKDLKTIITPLYSRNSDLGNIGLPEDLLKAVFDTEPDEVGDAYEDGGKLYLFQTAQRIDSHLPELKEVRGKVEAGVLVKKAMEAALEKARKMLASYEKGKSLNYLATSIHKKVMTLKPFTVMETSLPGIDDPEQVVQTAFSLPAPGKAAIATGKHAQYLVELEKFVKPDEKELEKNRSLIMGALIFQREQAVLKGYVEKLKEKMADKIVINKELQ